MANIFYDKDAGLSVLQYILNGTAKDAAFELAREDGFRVLDIPDLIRQVYIVFMLIPDETILDLLAELGLFKQMPLHSHEEVYKSDISKLEEKLINPPTQRQAWPRLP